MPASYFEAILRGVAQSPHYDTAERRNTTLASDLILRCHALPASPCGRDICWLIQRWNGSTWPEIILDTVAWYAMHDPNPTRDAWKPNREGNNAAFGSDAFTAGVNSVRGSATEAMGTLLFAMRESFLHLRPATESVCRDPSLAVQSVAVKPLLAILNIEPVAAIAWFSDMMIANPDLLGTYYVEKFLEYAGYKDYRSTRPVVLLMMADPDPKIAIAGTRKACFHGFDDAAAGETQPTLTAGQLPCVEVLHRSTHKMWGTTKWVQPAETFLGLFWPILTMKYERRLSIASRTLASSPLLSKRNF